MNTGRKPAQYCVTCGVEAKIEDTDKAEKGDTLPPCTNCGGKKFATAADYDRLFLQSLRIKPTSW